LPSNLNLHGKTKRAAPNMFCEYKTALLFYRTFNYKIQEDEWIYLNMIIINTTRQTRFETRRDHSLKILLNWTSNTFHIINDQISLTWLIKSDKSFSIDCKKLFISFNTYLPLLDLI
jgi:hypothetical protein